MNHKPAIRMKPYLLSAFISFALVVSCYSLLDIIGIFDPINAIIILQILSICVTIVLLMWVTDHIPFHTGKLTVIVDLLNIILVLFGYNLIYKMFPFNHFILWILGVIVVVYFGTYLLFVLNVLKDEHMINAQIRKAKQQEGENRNG